MEAQNQVTLGLQQIYEAWKLKGKNRSIASLSRKANLNYQDVRRTIQGEISPAFKYIAPLLGVMTTPKEAVAFYERHFPAEANLFKRVFRKRLDETTGEAQHFDKRVSEIFEGPYSFHVFILLACAGNKPVSKEYIVNQLGDFGDIILQSLLNEEIVIESSGGFVKLAKNLIVENPKEIADMIGKTTKVMALVNRQVNFINYHSASPKGIEKSLDIIRNAEMQLAELFSNPEHCGEIPISFFMALGHLGKEFSYEKK